MITLQEAFTRWARLQPELGHLCCNKSHKDIVPVTKKDRHGNPYTYYKEVDLPVQCEREVAWRVYLAVRDGKPIPQTLRESLI